MKLPTNYNKLTISDKKDVRKEYIKEQGGMCYFCGGLLDEQPPNHILDKPVVKSLFPPKFFDSPVHLHHNHETGMTIGAVHCYCNAVLWQYYNE